MGHILVKQPDGRFAMWSTMIDDFIAEDLTEKEMIEYESEAAKKHEIEIMKQLFDDLEKGKYEPMTYQECLDQRDEIHGKGNRA